MEANKADSIAIFELYKRSHDKQLEVETTDFDKKSRHDVDERLFEARMIDDDPLFNVEER